MKIHCSVSTYDLYTFLYACYTSTVLNNGKFRNFPGGPEVKNPPSNAGDVALIPSRGTKIPHASQQLSLSAATTEPTGHNQRTRAGLILGQESKIPHASVTPAPKKKPK